MAEPDPTWQERSRQGQRVILPDFTRQREDEACICLWHPPPNRGDLLRGAAPLSAETSGLPPLLGRFPPLSPSPLAAGAVSGCLSCAPTAMRGINHANTSHAREKVRTTPLSGENLNLPPRRKIKGISPQTSTEHPLIPRFIYIPH